MLWLLFFVSVFFFFKQKPAYELRISDWSSDVCSSDLDDLGERHAGTLPRPRAAEPVALRGGGLPPRPPALQRGGPHVLRPRRAALGHSALRHLDDLRLRRHPLLRRAGRAVIHRRPRADPAHPRHLLPCPLPPLHPLSGSLLLLATAP